MGTQAVTSRRSFLQISFLLLSRTARDKVKGKAWQLPCVLRYFTKRAHGDLCQLCRCKYYKLTVMSHLGTCNRNAAAWRLPVGSRTHRLTAFDLPLFLVTRQPTHEFHVTHWCDFHGKHATLGSVSHARQFPALSSQATRQRKLARWDHEAQLAPQTQTAHQHGEQTREWYPAATMTALRHPAPLHQ